MKKWLAVMLCICLGMCLMTGCQKQAASGDEKSKEGSSLEKAQEQSADINIGCMKGPTAIGMIKLLSDSDAKSSINHYNYTIAGTADELTTGLMNGSLDMAAVPCNLAAVLYHKTEGEIVTAAINTLGVLYLVETGNSIQTVKELKGKTIYSTGQGTTPEYTLRYLLGQEGLNPDTDLTIEYKSEAAEVVAALSQNEKAVAMLPQPYVTVAMAKNDKLRIALDLTKEWEKKNDSTVVTGVLVVRKSFLDEHPQAFASFLAEYEKSADFAVNNIDETAALLEQFDIFKADIAREAIPYCNVTFETGEEMQKDMSAYLKVLYEQNPAAVGGKLPEEGMFYLEGANK